MQKEGNVQLFVKPETSVIDAARFAPGEFPTDTGKINFYSPFLAERGRLKQKAARAQYVRPPEGIEDLLEGKKGAKGIAYICNSRHPICPTEATPLLTIRLLVWTPSRIASSSIRKMHKNEELPTGTKSMFTTMQDA